MVCYAACPFLLGCTSTCTRVLRIAHSLVQQFEDVGGSVAGVASAILSPIDMLCVQADAGPSAGSMPQRFVVSLEVEPQRARASSPDSGTGGDKKPKKHKKKKEKKHKEGKEKRHKHGKDAGGAAGDSTAAARPSPAPAAAPAATEQRRSPSASPPRRRSPSSEPRREKKRLRHDKGGGAASAAAAAAEARAATPPQARSPSPAPRIAKAPSIQVLQSNEQMQMIPSAGALGTYPTSHRCNRDRPRPHAAVDPAGDPPHLR